MEITGLSPTTTYFVQARFVNDGVYGEWSPSVTFYTTGAAPCKIRLVFSNTDSFPMSYLSGWGTATGYAKIYHSNGSNTEYLQSSYNSYYPATDNGVYYIDVVPCDSNGTESFSEYFSSMSLNSVGYLIGVVFSEGDGDFANLTYVQIVNCPYLTSVNAAALHNFASGSLLLSSNYNLNEVLLPADFKPYSFSVYQCPLATNMQAVVEHIDSRAGLGRGALDFQNVPYFYSSFAGYIDMWSTAYEYDVAYNTNM
jgi:hypothetical protein